MLLGVVSGEGNAQPGGSFWNGWRTDRLNEEAATFEVGGCGDRVLIGSRGLQSEAEEKLRQGRVRLVYPEIKGGRVIADVQVEGLGDYFVGERTLVYVATGQRTALVIPGGYLYRRFGVSYARLKSGTEVVVQPGMPVDDRIEILAGLKAGDVVTKP